MNPAVAISRAEEQIPATSRAEFEQAKLRVVIPAIVFVCFAGYSLFGGELSENERHALWFIIGFLLFGVGMLMHILAAPNVSIVRRLLGIVADNACITYFMLIAGEQGAAIWWIYLFITFGNGLRYGRRYLQMSQALSMLGFAVVCYSSDFWSHHLWVAAGLFLAMVELPLYVGLLATQMQQAKKKAETALHETQQQVRELSRKLAELTPPAA